MADSKISALPASTTPLAGTEVLPIVQSSTTKQVSVANLTAGRSLTMAGLTVTTTTGDLSVNVTTTGTANAASLVITNGNGTTSAGYSYARFVNSQTSPQDWRIGTYGTAALSFVNSTAGNIPANFDTAGNFSLALNNLYFSTAAKGVNFTANTPAAGMTSQLLNWYEEGTFTPTIVGTSTAGTATYGTQTATYTRIGRMVYFALELNWTSGTGTGYLRVGGLPYTCGANNCSVSIGDIENVALTASYTAGAYVGASSTQIVLREFQVGGGGNNPVAYDAAGILRIGGCYYV